MSEAIIVGAIKKLESFKVETQNMDTYHEGILNDIANELRMMLDFLSDMESEERSRLNYLLADFAEIAQVSVDHKTYSSLIANAPNWLRKTKKRMKEFGVGEGVSKPQSVGEEGVVVVGLEKDVQQLIGRVILNRKPNLAISSIKGMVGLGKTTLARQVYTHAAIIDKFKRRLWVSISSDTSITEVLMDLLQQLVELDGDSLLMENWSLQEMLYHHLQGMPYFIVLDNMLPEMFFDAILDGLPNEGYGSRVLLTSRCEIMTTYLCYTHEMKTLDSDKSWQLFLKTIIMSDENVLISKDLEKKGREMLKKCGGLPIAIMNVGRQKAEQRLLGVEWEELFDTVDLSESIKLLEPMYDCLNEELKACFLHFSFFKENAIMREEKLEQIWAATGLNTFRSCRYLFRQSFIEVVHPCPRNGEVKKCRTNPLLHRLSIKKAEEEMGFEILSNDGNNQPSQSPSHRVINCGRNKFNHSTNQDKHLVSLIFHGGGRYLDDVGQYYWKRFELLKILDMEDFGVKTLSQTIGLLIELRYLGLRNNYIQEIPHSFVSFEKLEVLDIALNFMVEVPNIINKIGSLRHLYMSDVIYRNPLKVDALQNLETLAYISIYNWTYEVSNLEKMTCLYKLGIEEIDEYSDVNKLFASLAKLESLRSLTLRGFRFRSMPCLDEIGVLHNLFKLTLHGRLARLPSADSIHRIRDMALVNTCLGDDPMPVLQMLPMLHSLKLRNAYTGREMMINGFHRLEVVWMSELWNLRDIQVGDGAMFELKQLEIENCPHLETLQHGSWSMRNLIKFKMVTNKHTSTKIGNWDSFSNVMEVDISL